MSDQLYRVAARSKLTGWSGSGRPMSKELAEAWASYGNREHPAITHWVEAERGVDDAEGSMTAKKPQCKLIGEDGNVFSIIGRVSKALTRAGMPELAKEFTGKAFAADSYDAVLRLCLQYVEVE